MKITVYELLGLVKDGKAPKKIKFNYSIYEYKWSNAYQEKCYVNGNNYRLWENLNLNSNLNDEVEIIEEPKKTEYEQIEELTCNEYDFETKTINSLIKNQRKLIDEINNLKEKKDE